MKTYKTLLNIQNTLFEQNAQKGRAFIIFTRIPKQSFMHKVYENITNSPQRMHDDGGHEMF